MLKFCSVCNKTTDHRELEPAGFLVQTIIAIITSFQTDLREDQFECNNCGKRS